MGRFGRAVVLAAFALCLTAGPATAATFTVNTTSDAVDGSATDGVCSAAAAAGGICTLRAAVQQANALAGSDTIVLPAGNYSLTIGGTADDAAARGDLDVTQSLAIDGAGARTTVVDQAIADGVFDVRPNAGSVTFEGLTIRGGQLAASPGAGLANRSTTFLVDAAVRDNANARSPGGGVYSSGSLTVDRSLIAANTTGSAAGGGGIYNDGGRIVLRNSTLSGNGAPTGAALTDAGNAPDTTIEHSTVTANAPGAGGAAITRGGAGQIRVRDSIVAANAGADCAGAVTTFAHNIESGTSCGFTSAGAGDRQNTDPLLGALAYSAPGDQTETHGPQPGSPAIDGGVTAGCPAVDQRGAGRPSGSTCDVGAVEVQQAGAQPQAPRPAALALDPADAGRRPGDANTVSATARNDDGSPAVGRTIRYEIAGPNAGNGIATTDGAGVAAIAWDGVHEGADTLTAYVDTNGDATHGADEPVAQAKVRWTLPAPVQGRSVNLEPISGVARIRLPRRAAAGRVNAAGSVNNLLTEARQVPVGTSVDVRRGRVRMTTAAGRGKTQNGQFYGGVYVTSQPRRGKLPVTELRLTESLTCRATRRGRVTTSRARSRRLWGNGRGRFRTRGRHSVATVRGTIWLQKDTCTTTTTTVRRGSVVVRDLAKRRNVTVKAPRRYVARARRR